MPKAIDITGRTYGRLTVVSLQGERKCKQRMWLCKCSCGKDTTVSYGNLSTGTVKSCGCLNRDVVIARSTKHGEGGLGEKRSKEYATLHSMRYRCHNPRSKDYAMYGGRGITVCKRWMGDDGVANFIADMGRAPSQKHSIDRKDNKGNYEPSNCRWATTKEQCNNKSNNIVIERDGIKLTARQWERKLGIKKGMVSYRYRKGKPVHEILAVA